MTPKESRPDAPTGRPPRRAPVVLIVDDHDDTRFLHRYVLEERGYGVVEAADGEEAVRVAERESPDLILMDAHLPLLDGLAATRRIRESASLQRVPVLFLSGHAEPSFRALALEAGCDEYLVKPVALTALGDAVEKYFRREATTPPPAAGVEV